jgi:hypothetical protein
MKRFLISAAAVAAISSGVPLAQAASPVSQGFTVQVTLAAQCRVQPAQAPVLDFGTYTAFVSATNPSPTIDILFECTRGLVPISAVFDTANGSANGDGAIAGLNYTMSVNNAAGVLTSAGTLADATTAGTAAVRTYTVTGGMLGGQAGTTGVAASHTRTLFVSY